MEYVEFGRTGRRVSRIGFGGAVAGLKNYLHEYDPDRDESRKGVIAAIDKDLELGVTYFDTAPGYGNGRSESMFGEALKAVNPKDIFLATKLPYGDRDHVLRSAAESLKRLGRDQIDLLQIHGNSYSHEQVDFILGKNGMLAAMEELKKQGAVRHLGFTTEDNNDAIYRLMQSGRFDAIQMCYNFIFQHPYEPSRPFGSLLEAEKCGLGVATMRAPTSGTFQRWIAMVNPGNTFDYTRALIQFVLSNPHVDVALIGMRSAKRVIENVDICNDTAGRIDLPKLHTRYV